MSSRGATEFDKRLGEAVRAQRKLRNMSQSELAKALGLTFQQVQKYERGANRIAVSTLVKIAEALDHPIMHFLNAVDAPVILDAEDIAMLDFWRELDGRTREVVLELFAVLKL